MKKFLFLIICLGLLDLSIVEGSSSSSNRQSKRALIKYITPIEASKDDVFQVYFALIKRNKPKVKKVITKMLQGPKSKLCASFKIAENESVIVIVGSLTEVFPAFDIPNIGFATACVDGTTTPIELQRTEPETVTGSFP